MGNDSDRTDYTDREVFARHATESIRRHDKYTLEIVKIVVGFDPNFDEFAAKVAYELRTRTIYRSDGGKNARGLVRASGDLAKLHYIFRTGSPPPAAGTKIGLIAILARRKDPRDTFRWIMSIRFNAPGWIDGDEMVVTASPAVTAKSDEQMMKNVIHYGALYFQDIHNDKGRRITKMVEIADRLGYPRNQDLWYYSSEAVDNYMNWRNKAPDEETNPNRPRGRMATATGGKLPFDGDTGFPLVIPWRIYPFRNAAQLCKGLVADECKVKVVSELIHTEAEIGRNFDVVLKRTAEASSIPHSLNPLDTPEKNVGPLAVKLHEHLVKLTTNNDSLYSVGY